MSMAPADDGAAGADVDVKSADGISAVSGVFHPRALFDFHGKCYAFSAQDPNGTRIFSSLSDFVSLTNSRVFIKGTQREVEQSEDSIESHNVPNGPT